MKKVIPKNAILIPDNATRVFTGIIFDVYQWPQKMFDGSTQTFEMLKRVDTASAIAIKDDKIVVVEVDQPNSYRQLAFPGGRIEKTDKDASTLAAAQREVLEETGMRFKKWRLIHVQQGTQKVEGFFYWYLATDFIDRVEPEDDPGERIKVKLDSYAEVRVEVLTNPDLAYVRSIFNRIHSLQELKVIAEYIGQEVDR